MSKTVRICRLVMFLFVAFAWLGTDAYPASKPAEKTDVMVKPDAIRCWWFAYSSAVRIGEEFTVILTCRLDETGNVKPRVDESALDAAAISLAPWQVRSGLRHQDVVVGEGSGNAVRVFRYTQYAYKLALGGENYFGKEAVVPKFAVPYRFEMTVDGETSQLGKDRTYELPPIPLRVHSLVPKDARTIRDVMPESFGQNQMRMRYAVIAGALALFALLLPPLMAVPALVRALKRRKAAASNGTDFRTGTLLNILLRELRRIGRAYKKDASSLELNDRLAAVYRIAFGLAAGTPIIQTHASASARGLLGQLKVRKGWLFRKKVLISSSMTPSEAGTCVWPGTAEAKAAFTALNGSLYRLERSAADAPEADSFVAALVACRKFCRRLRKERWLVMRASRWIAAKYRYVSKRRRA